MRTQFTIADRAQQFWCSGAGFPTGIGLAASSYAIRLPVCRLWPSAATGLTVSKELGRSELPKIFQHLTEPD